MPDDLTMYKVFIASPGGLRDVRTAFCDVIDEYNDVDARRRGVMFIAVGWEDTLPGIGRPQDTINQDVRACDYFVMVHHDRWGSPSDNKGKKGKGGQGKRGSGYFLGKEKGSGTFFWGEERSGILGRAVTDSGTVCYGEQKGKNGS